MLLTDFVCFSTLNCENETVSFQFVLSNLILLMTPLFLHAIRCRLYYFCFPVSLDAFTCTVHTHTHFRWTTKSEGWNMQNIKITTTTKKRVKNDAVGRKAAIFVFYWLVCYEYFRLFTVRWWRFIQYCSQNAYICFALLSTWKITHSHNFILILFEKKKMKRNNNKSSHTNRALHLFI